MISNIAFYGYDFQSQPIWRTSIIIIDKKCIGIYMTSQLSSVLFNIY